jgi:hypothetical protein
MLQKCEKVNGYIFFWISCGRRPLRKVREGEDNINIIKAV